MSKKNIIWLTVGVLVCATLGAFLLQRQDVGNGLVDLVASDEIESQGGKIELQSIDTTPVVVPDLGHMAVFTASVTPEAKAIMLKKIAELQQKLGKDGKDFNVWNSLAQYYQTAGDYAAAGEVWEYLGRVFPANHVAYGNLGFLYGYYVKDAALAEKNYLKAIENAPEQVFLYFQAAEFYRDVVKSRSKALEMAQKGLAYNPNSTELKQLIQTLK